MGGRSQLQVDVATQVPLFSLSFILRNMLPATRIISNSQSLAAHLVSDRRETASLLFSGSSIQALNLPPLYPVSRDRGATSRTMPTDSSDVDLMVVFGNDEGLLIESEESHPGYARLVCSCLERLPDSLKTLGPLAVVKQWGKTFLSSRVLVQTVALCQALRKHPSIGIDDIVRTVAGHAERLEGFFTEDGSVDLCALQKHFGIKSSAGEDNSDAIAILKVKMSGPSATHLQKDTSYDTVAAIASLCWPRQAQEWLKRARPSGWPSVQLVQQVSSRGCHFVPTAHRHSLHPDVEWRFSFSEAENLLAASLGDVHRQCFILLKALSTDVLDPPRKVLTSYHMKTVLFWLLERYTFECELGHFFLALLDELLHCLIRREIRNYFMPENNMLAHVHSDFVRDMARKVSDIRRDPLKYLFQFNRRTLFCFSPEKPWEDVFRPVLQRKSLTVSAACHVHLEALCLLLESYLSHGLPDRKIKHESVLDVAKEVVFVGRNMGCQMSTTNGYLMAAADSSHLHSGIAIYFTAYIMQKFYNDVGMQSVLEVHRNEIELMKREKLESMADRAFQQDLASNERFLLQEVEYARFLCNVGRDAESEIILLQILRANCQDPPSTQNLYSRSNFASLDTEENPRGVLANVIGFACTILVRLYHEKGEKAKALCITQQLVGLCGRLSSEQFPVTYVMAVDCLLLLGETEVAVKLSKKFGVIQNHPESETSGENASNSC